MTDMKRTTRPDAILILRFLAVAAMAVWMGGFTFYGGVVVPILHDTLDSLQAGGITRAVTDRLNLIGAVASSLWWIVLTFDRDPYHTRALPRALLAIITLLLIAQAILHSIMDHRLDAGRLRDFYPWHRAYLIVSTAQWAFQLVLMAVTLRRWTRF
jgi:hypothetical protein